MKSNFSAYKGLGINLSTGKDSPKQGQQASEGIGAIEIFFRSYSNSRKPGFLKFEIPYFITKRKARLHTTLFAVTLMLIWRGARRL